VAVEPRAQRLEAPAELRQHGSALAPQPVGEAGIEQEFGVLVPDNQLTRQAMDTLAQMADRVLRG
jgi:hypothetical protein